MESSSAPVPPVPPIRRARCSGGEFAREGYPCHYPWPPNCFVQAGARGVVFQQEGGAYRTAFFEAFPRSPGTFLRGEGETVQQAEEACWSKYQGMLACPEHEFDRRGRRDGYVFCRHCALSGMFAEPLEHCHTCGIPAHYGQDSQGHWYCEVHYEALPPELWSESRKRLERMRREMDEEEREEMTPEQLQANLLAAQLAIEVVTELAVQGERQVGGIEDLAEQTDALLRGKREE